MNLTFTVADSSLLSLNSSSISDVVFLPASPPPATANNSRGPAGTDWQLLENEARAVASSVVKSKRENAFVLGDGGDSIGGSPMVNLDGSLNLLTGLERYLLSPISSCLSDSH